MKTYMEFRTCAGGEEAQDFMLEIMTVYLKYARKNNLNTELIGDGKTKVILFEGKDEFIKPLVSEDGIHRVQRVSKGKLHTSTISIAVLPITQKVTIQINSKDLRFENYRGSGNGGQHRNKTDSAVRVTHLPTGVVVYSESERSQYLNKAIVMEMLQSKLQQMQDVKVIQKQNQDRSSQVGNGDRAEARRTYNYVRSEVSDHITNKQCSLKEFLKGNILEIK